MTSFIKHPVEILSTSYFLDTYSYLANDYLNNYIDNYTDSEFFLFKRMHGQQMQIAISPTGKVKYGKEKKYTKRKNDKNFFKVVDAYADAIEIMKNLAIEKQAELRFYGSLSYAKKNKTIKIYDLSIDNIFVGQIELLRIFIKINLLDMVNKPAKKITGLKNAIMYPMFDKTEDAYHGFIIKPATGWLSSLQKNTPLLLRKTSEHTNINTILLGTQNSEIQEFFSKYKEYLLDNTCKFKKARIIQGFKRFYPYFIASSAYHRFKQANPRPAILSGNTTKLIMAGALIIKEQFAKIQQEFIWYNKINDIKSRGGQQIHAIYTQANEEIKKLKLPEGEEEIKKIKRQARKQQNIIKHQTTVEVNLLLSKKEVQDFFSKFAVEKRKQLHSLPSYASISI